MAVAITNSGQMLFLYRTDGEGTRFFEYYSLHWVSPELPWIMETGDQTYLFQLPDNIAKLWLDNATNELEMKRAAVDCKTNFLSNMIVYYTENTCPVIKMISIDRYQLENARKNL
jgi:hypothetical protein